jgi:hypothetical protein
MRIKVNREHWEAAFRHGSTQRPPCDPKGLIRRIFQTIAEEEKK